MNKNSISLKFKHLVRMFKSTILCILILLSCDNKPQHTTFDITQHIECSLEDCIEEYAIYPLKSDIPINQIEFGMSFDSLTFYKSSNGKEIYYFINNEYISKLASIGRGPGEYMNINNYTYNPHNNTIVISSENEKFHIYSLPDMNIVRTVNRDGFVKGMYPLSDSTILTVNHCDEKFQNGCGIYIVNINNGHSSLIAEIPYINSFWFSGNEFVHTDSSVLIPVSGCPNRIIEYKNNKISDLATITFNNNNIPKEIYAKGINTIDEKMNFTNFFLGNDYKIGCLYPIITDSLTTLWHTPKTNSQYQYMMLAYNNSSYINFSFHIPGINRRIIPDYVANGYYVLIIQEPIDYLIDTSENLSKLGKEIIDTMKKQNNNNPILLYFKIKPSILNELP